MNIKTGRQLADACILLAKKYKTLYIMGCFGAPMTDDNKIRYTTNHPYNKKPERAAKIQAASSDTFGFDCVGMIKGLLWDWSGELDSIYGGANYANNNIPDLSANGMLSVCGNTISTDFTNIQIGEVVWMQDHIGVYVGNGLAVECTPRWNDGCQITAVFNIGTKSAYNGRAWTKHGKLPYLAYEKTPNIITPTKAYGLEEFIKDVQKACGAVVDGVAGPQTLEKTITVNGNYMRHAVVKPIQKRLYVLGYTQVGTADGVTGPKFTDAVKEFQKDNDCVADGVITAKNKTWKALLGMITADPDSPSEYTKEQFIREIQAATGSNVDGIYGPETLKNTITVNGNYMRHAVVKPLQKRLYALGYKSIGDADGVTGPKFTEAVKNFQSDHGNYVDGIITARNITWQKLLTL